MKAAPDYWKKGIRKQFNDILKKYGATSREKDSAGALAWSLQFTRDIAVLVSGPTSLMPHRDVRAVALLKALSKWLHGLTQEGYTVKAYYMPVGGSQDFGKSSTANQIHLVLKDAARVEDNIDWLKTRGERGEKMPICFNLKFTVLKS